MNAVECAKVLAKIQLVDNREVSELVILDWMDYIGDLEFADAVAAVVRFRRERPGQYLEPGHVLELAGVQIADASVPDITADIIAESRRRTLEAAGVTEAEYEAHELDAAWVNAKFAAVMVEAEPKGFGDE